jgi:hypothetical protein
MPVGATTNGNNIAGIMVSAPNNMAKLFPPLFEKCNTFSGFYRRAAFDRIRFNPILIATIYHIGAVEVFT